MKPHLDIAHRGTLGALNRVGMTFDENSIAHLMSILTDLYSDQELACIREYSTNAADSHVRAGLTKPIEIQLPTELTDQTFVVKDYGVGMSAKEIYENFSKYGWSSKRDDDTETGMLGLGCKSGLTYTSQFTMVCNKDGIQNVVLVTRQESGAGAVQIINTEETDEPDGVEVRIPVANVASFRNRAIWFYRFWDRGTVLVDGIEPEPYQEAADLHLDPDVFITRELDHDYFVMGNVPYPIPEEMIPGRYGWQSAITTSGSNTTASYFISCTTSTSGQFGINSSTSAAITTSRVSYAGSRGHYHAVFKVAIGDINFTPSREQLQMTKRTKEAIHIAKLFLENTYYRVAQEEIEACTNHQDAMAVAAKWSDAWVRAREFTYRGDVVPRDFYPPHIQWSSEYDDEDDDKHWTRAWDWNLSYQRGMERLNSVSFKDAHKALHVIGHANKQVNSATKEKVRAYMEENELDFKRVFFYPKPFGRPWLDGVPMVPYDVIRGRKSSKPRAAAESGWRVLSRTGRTPIATGLVAPDAWIIASQYPSNRQELYEKFQNTVLGRVPNIVFIPKDRVQKFKDEFPGVPEMTEFIQATWKAFHDGLTEIEKFNLAQNARFQNYSNMSQMFVSHPSNLNRIQDDELRHVLVDAAAMHSQNNTRYNGIRSMCVEFSVPVPSAQPDVKMAELIDKLNSRYPLLGEITRYRSYQRDLVDVVIQYVNGQFFLSQIGLVA